MQKGMRGYVGVKRSGQDTVIRNMLCKCATSVGEQWEVLCYPLGALKPPSPCVTHHIVNPMEFSVSRDEQAISDEQPAL